MKEFLENKDDYTLIETITFGDNSSKINIKEQISGILFKTKNIESAFETSLEFLEQNLESVLEANKSLDIIESRITALKASLNFITKIRLEIDADTKGVSIVDMSKGEFNGTIYNVTMQGLTLDTELASEQVI